MKISEFPRAMRQILGKGNKYYVSKNNFNQLEEVSKVPLIEDQEPRIMAKDGYPNLGLESYTEEPKIYEGDSITDLRNAAIERLMPDMGLKASINFTENMSIEFLKDILSLDPRTSIAGGYTKDGFTVGGLYEPNSGDKNFYVGINKKFQDGGVVEREGFNGGTDPNELLSKKEIELFKKEIEDAYPGVKINDTKAGKRNPRTIELRYRRKQGDKKFALKRGLIPTKENLDLLRETAKDFSDQAKMCSIFAIILEGRPAMPWGEPGTLTITVSTFLSFNA